MLPLSVAVPTYGREEVLLATLGMLLEQTPPAAEILVLDQTRQHQPGTSAQLQSWDTLGKIRWIPLEKPSQPQALNAALLQATQPYVLFLDDDIRIDSGFLQAHCAAFDSDAVWAAAGQVLQPGEVEDGNWLHQPAPGPFCDADFVFRSAHKTRIQNGMSGNLSVRRERALQIGGFDENFVPPVAYRFDNEFCKRLCRAGGSIVFEPKARIYHLRASKGGTRTNSCHLTSMSPEHGVGDYYFAMLQGPNAESRRYMARRMVREVCTRFHLKHPWWIPVKLIGELRALLWANRLVRQGQKLIGER